MPRSASRQRSAKPDRRPTWRLALDEFARDVARIAGRGGLAQHGIDYLPGAAELGDFDADLDHDRLRAGRRPSRRTEAADRADLRALLARVRSTRATAAKRGKTTRLTSCARSAPSCGSVGTSARRNCLPSSWPTAARRVEPMGRGGRPRRAQAALRRRHAARAGSLPTSSAPSSTCSRTSAAKMPRWSSPRVFRLPGSTGTAFASPGCTRRSAG